MDRQQSANGLTIVMRWLARLGSLISVVLLLLFLFGEGFTPSELTFAEWIGLLFFPGGVTVGMLLAWRWETLGGVITLLSLLGFYMVLYSDKGRFPEGFWFALFALPGLIFLICGLRSRKQTHSMNWAG
jgi:hypothetical protein